MCPSSTCPSRVWGGRFTSNEALQYRRTQDDAPDDPYLLIFLKHRSSRGLWYRSPCLSRFFMPYASLVLASPLSMALWIAVDCL